MPEDKVDKLNESLNGIVDLQKSLNGVGGLFQSVNQSQQNANANANTAGNVSSEDLVQRK